MGFSLSNNIPENFEVPKYTSKKKIYPDGSWTCVHCDNKIFTYKFDREWKKKCDTDVLFYELYNGDIVKASEYVGDGFDIKDQFWFNDVFKSADTPKNDDDEHIKLPRGDKVDVEHSLHRAKSKIFDITMCNDWSYFFTGTFADDDLQHDPKKCLAKMRSWLNNQVKRKGLQYILVAEYTPINHLIHFHGLFNNAAFTYDFNDMYSSPLFKKPVKLKTLQNRGISPDTCKKVYNIREWQQSFGWCTAIPTYGNKVALARYITKYITKDCEKIFGKYYWSSKNIVRDPDIELFNVSYDYWRDDLPEDFFVVPFSNEYLKYDCSSRTRGVNVETKGN